MTSNSQWKTDKLWFDLQFHDPDKKYIKKPDELKIGKEDFPPSTIDQVVLNRILGSIYGLALGDALGAHVEFRPHSYLAANPVTELVGGGTWGLQKGQFTDDTSMALCLANSLIACGAFVPYDQLVRYKWWYRHGYMSSTGSCFDIGAATRQSIQEFEMRQRRFAQRHDISFDEMDLLSDSKFPSPFDINCSKDGVAGNGALMRLAPVPLFFYRDPEKAVEYSGISGRITHGDDKAYDACRYYGALIVAALQGAKKDELLSETFYNDHKSWFGSKTLHQDIMNIATKGSFKKQGGYEAGIRGKGYIVNALEAALWAFWSDKDSFETGALNAVNLGDDTDTTAAIYGQLAGAYYGFEKLPKNWFDFVYATNFIKCVSHWIAYGGEQWFTNQKSPDTVKPTDCSNLQSSTTTSNTAIDPKLKFDFSNYDSPNKIISVVLTLLATIERKVIDPEGHIGCLYDGCRDCIVKSPSIQVNTKIKQARPSIICYIEKGDNRECQNLLQLIGFDDELRLSVASDIVSPKGIASLVEYPYLIDECTRVLYYSCTTRQESLSDDVSSTKQSIQQLTSGTLATHVITGINRGIDVIVLLRLPSVNTEIIDDTLQGLCEYLTKDTTLPDKHSLDQILSTHIYSNMPFLSEQKTIIDVCQAISSIKQNDDIHWPSTYILQPIKEFYPDDNKTSAPFLPLEQEIIQGVEQHLFRLSCVRKMRATILDRNTCDILNTDLTKQLQEAQEQLKILTARYETDKTRFKKLIINIREGKYKQQAIKQELLPEKESATLRGSIDDLNYCLTSLKVKANFIMDLNKQGFDYRNAANYGIERGDDENKVQSKLRTEKNQRIVCSNDILNVNNWSGLNERLSRMMEERDTNQDLHFIYVDFSYSSYELDMIKNFPEKNYDVDRDENKFETLTNNGPQGAASLMSSSDQTINVLLLGKSGVGKSTLINTLENYLKFKTYTEVQASRSILRVIIPFLFPFTADFEEHIVSLGDNDPNENHEHPGQSITQRCKSYICNVGDQKKLRIIDTPGFSDTHSQTQNEFIMQHILSRITNLIHLNAVCVVLESSDSKLDAYKPCLEQLFRFLGDDAQDNVVFCFTKTLSSSINRNEKIARLRSMLESLSIKNIPFNDKNTFDFDSTYFLHFARGRYSIPFFEQQDPNCEKSWSTSKKAWDDLLEYVRENLNSYFIHQGLQNVEYARLEIKQLIRPVMEAIRNALRNILMWETESTKVSIKLHPKPILHPSAICYSCTRTRRIYGRFWITLDAPHDYWNKCNSCNCDPDQHVPVAYQLDYEYTSNQANDARSQMIGFQKELFYASLHFAQFLMNMDRTLRIDSFLSSLDRMINEESFICENIHNYHLNSMLHDNLRKMKDDYRHKMDFMVKKRVENDLTFIDNLIQRVKQIPMVREQINAAQEMQEMLV